MWSPTNSLYFRNSAPRKCHSWWTVSVSSLPRTNCVFDITYNCATRVHGLLIARPDPSSVKALLPISYSLPSYFKGPVSREGFFEGLKTLISTFRLSKAFHYPIEFLTFYLLFLSDLLILKMLTETLLIIPFSVIGRCSPVPTPHWLQGKCARWPSLRFYRITGIFSVKIAAVGFLNRVTERIFKISK
jgi:hypothetical protein